MTIDYEQDLKCINLLTNKLGFNASWVEYSTFILNNKSLFKNQSIVRNEGLLKSLKNDK